MTEAPLEGLALRLREAGEAELAVLLERHLAELDPDLVHQVLRNPYVTAAMLDLLARQQRLIAAYEVRRDLAHHPRTPQNVAFRFVSGLHWPDLVRIGADIRLHPLVRRAAEQRLIERLPGMSMGEKMSLARTASAGVLSELRFDPSPRVVGALLENPRLTEGTLAPLLASDRAQGQVLALIAANPRWGSRYPIRVALARNPRTPLATALALLVGLKKPDLRQVAADPTLAPAVRQRAQLLGQRASAESL